MRRQIFTANKFEGLIHKEIADRNGITTTRVDNEPRKTISALRFSLKDYPTIFVSMKPSPPETYLSTRSCAFRKLSPEAVPPPPDGGPFSLSSEKKQHSSDKKKT